MVMSSEIQLLIIHHYQSDSKQNLQKEFKADKHIPSIEFTGCKLKHFPDAALEHNEVEYLTFFDCNLVNEAVVQSVAQLTNLKKLDVSQCRLQWFPQSVTQLKSLTELSLWVTKV